MVICDNYNIEIGRVNSWFSPFLSRTCLDGYFCEDIIVFGGVIMVYPDIVWPALAIIGGFLLIENASNLSKQGRLGVIVIFIAFLGKVYWELLHQTEVQEVTWNLASQIGVGFVTLMVVVLVLFIYPGPLGKRRKRGQ